MAKLGCQCGNVLSNSGSDAPGIGGLVRSNDLIATSKMVEQLHVFAQITSQVDRAAHAASLFAWDLFTDLEPTAQDFAEVAQAFVNVYVTTKELDVWSCYEDCGRIYIEAHHGERRLSAYVPDRSSSRVRFDRPSAVGELPDEIEFPCPCGNTLRWEGHRAADHALLCSEHDTSTLKDALSPIGVALLVGRRDNYIREQLGANMVELADDALHVHLTENYARSIPHLVRHCSPCGRIHIQTERQAPRFASFRPEAEQSRVFVGRFPDRYTWPLE